MKILRKESNHMKRSQLNAIIQDAEQFFAQHCFLLPPWGHWRIEDWEQAELSGSEIVSHQLGWDITDFGSENFGAEGLVLFTIRNGSLEPGGKPYAEKIMIVNEQQVTPWHYHWKKTEDIINRGGGNLVVRLAGSTPEGEFTQEPLTVMVDGILRKVGAQETVTLRPGESICLPAGMYHTFWAEKGKGRVLVGEVSVVSDDWNDNRFYKELPRFPAIEEDVSPHRLLTCDYAARLPIQ
jgi:D-lyxose ketol-isomerase